MPNLAIAAGRASRRACRGPRSLPVGRSPLAPALARAGPVGGAVALRRRRQASVVARFQGRSVLAPGRAPATLPATGRLRRSSLATQPPYHYATAMAAFDATRLSPTRAPFEK